MITKYPNFAKPDIELKVEIQEFTQKFEPFSDFNFTSMFCWDYNKLTEVSMLNNNLVIKLPDYTENSILYSILGETNIDESIIELLKISPKLELVPEIVINNIKNKKMFNIEEDRDQFDYIYELEKQSNLSGKKFKVKRNKIHKFLKVYEDLNVKKINFKDSESTKIAIKIVNDWAINRKRNDFEIIREKNAIRKLFKHASSLNLIGIFVIVDGKYVGFTVNEVVNDDYAICHFQKSLLDIEHVDVFLTNLVSKELNHYTCKYVNWEQDLGIPGLRELKNSYGYDFFLKKYTVEKA